MLNLNSDGIVNRLDDRINLSIKEILKLVSESQYLYTIDDLHKLVNSEETLLEYIRDTEHEFSLPRKELESLGVKELNEYIYKLDQLWR